MKRVFAGGPPPASTDSEGWRKAIEDGALTRLPLESMVAALQDLDPRTASDVRRALLKYLSDAASRILRGAVGFHHPNRGEDIIYRVHTKICEALFRPESSDGQALRAGFADIVNFRVKDAIATENKHSRIPVEAHLNEFAEQDDSGSTLPTPANDPLCAAEEKLDVERILALVAEDRKRLAFRLYMNKPETGSTDRDIAKAVGVSTKTLVQWVEEVRTELQSKKEVQDLRKLSVGEKP
ncbi:hypothetical protein [Reyranella sp.]|uniref:hypothetical protein n=1 Tax=Reyranella sp. TaxID=1929291 RepID=UPI0011F9260C|nr:hypothetical protein [Reyranella sp.]TAJ81848.1 MAG: hypothetical protein EPO50_29010 [Reyranella sp.]